MGNPYLDFKPSYSHEVLIQLFPLTLSDLQLLLACRGEANRCGMTLLLKALPYLGFLPERLGRISREVSRPVGGFRDRPPRSSDTSTSLTCSYGCTGNNAYSMSTRISEDRCSLFPLGTHLALTSLERYRTPLEG